MSVEAALQHESWKATMVDKLLALIRNTTWSLVVLPSGRRAIGCKWVFKVKENSDETILKYKAPLVAKGSHQIVGFDFIETFSLMVKSTTIRIVLTITVIREWSIHQLDVNSVFLNGNCKKNSSWSSLLSLKIQKKESQYANFIKLSMA